MDFDVFLILRSTEHQPSENLLISIENKPEIVNFIFITLFIELISKIFYLIVF